MRNPRFRAVCFCLCLLSLLCCGRFAGAQSWNAQYDFDYSNNPSKVSTMTPVWSYGWKSASELYSTAFHPYDIAAWGSSDPASGGSSIYKVGSSGNYYYAGVEYRGNSLLLGPGTSGQYAVARWTAPAAGTVSISGSFQSFIYYQGNADVHVLVNGVEKFAAQALRPVFGIGDYLAFDTALSSLPAVQAGDVVEFAVGGAAQVRLVALVNLNRPAAGAGPVCYDTYNFGSLNLNGVVTHINDFGQVVIAAYGGYNGAPSNVYLLTPTQKNANYPSINPPAFIGSGEPTAFNNHGDIGITGNLWISNTQTLYTYQFGGRPQTWRTLLNDNGRVLIDVQYANAGFINANANQYGSGSGGTIPIDLSDPNHGFWTPVAIPTVVYDMNNALRFLYTNDGSAIYAGTIGQAGSEKLIDVDSLGLGALNTLSINDEGVVVGYTADLSHKIMYRAEGWPAAFNRADVYPRIFPASPNVLDLGTTQSATANHLLLNRYSETIGTLRGPIDYNGSGHPINNYSISTAIFTAGQWTGLECALPDTTDHTYPAGIAVNAAGQIITYFDGGHNSWLLTPMFHLDTVTATPDPANSHALSVTVTLDHIAPFDILLYPKDRKDAERLPGGGNLWSDSPDVVVPDAVKIPAGHSCVTFALTFTSAAALSHAHLFVDYHDKTLSCSLALKTDPTYVTVPRVTGMVGESKQFYGLLRYVATKVGISGETVTFKVDGVAVGSGITNAYGLASFNYIMPESVGNHSLTAGFAGDTSNSPSSGSAILTVTPANTLLAASNKEGKVGWTVVLKARLHRVTDGVFLSGKNVSFTVDGKQAGTGVTDANGYATVNYLLTAAGKFTIKAAFAGDGTNNASSGTSNLIVVAP